MGLATFRQGSNTTGGALLHRMKPIPITSQIYGQNRTSDWPVPVVRVGAGTKSFSPTANQIILRTTNSDGSGVDTATVVYNTYLASSNPCAVHMNSADTCLYVLLNASSTYRLIKINDTTGVVTPIGTSFTPTTPANWPTLNLNGSMEVGVVSGNIEVRYNGFTHVINKSTGAIISQDTAIVLGSFLAKDVIYVTQDGVIGLTTGGGNNITGEYIIPATVHSSYGLCGSYSLAQSLAGSVRSTAASAALLSSTDWFLVDNDKVMLGRLVNSGAVIPKLYYRTDFDKLIKSISDLGNGVI